MWKAAREKIFNVRLNAEMSRKAARCNVSITANEIRRGSAEEICSLQEMEHVGGEFFVRTTEEKLLQ